MEVLYVLEKTLEKLSADGAGIGITFVGGKDQAENLLKSLAL